MPKSPIGLEPYECEIVIVRDDRNGESPGKQLTVFLSPELFDSWYTESDFAQRSYPMTNALFDTIRDNLSGVRNAFVHMPEYNDFPRKKEVVNKHYRPETPATKSITTKKD